MNEAGFPRAHHMVWLMSADRVLFGAFVAQGWKMELASVEGYYDLSRFLSAWIGAVADVR